jgi:DNA-directed RNA polymerase specialized sigma24 family protein
MLTIYGSALLAKWEQQRTGKLRSFICGVVRNTLANQQRVAHGRQRLLKKLAEQGGLSEIMPVSESAEPSVSELDAFYQAWVNDLLASSVQQLLAELHAEGRGDYFRALFGRVCEGLTAVEIGTALNVLPQTVENYLRVARSRLSHQLQKSVRRHVERYSRTEDIEADFQSEWTQLGEHLSRHGGLEQVLRLAAIDLPSLDTMCNKSALYQSVRMQISAHQTPASN